MSEHTLLRRSSLAAAALVFLIVAAIAPAASAQAPISTPPIIDPYTGGVIPPGLGGGNPSLSINVTVASPGQRVRVRGCRFVPGTFIRFTLNPGNNQNPGVPCVGAQNALGDGQPVDLAGVGGLRQVLEFEPIAQTSTTTNRCPYDHPADAAGPDTNAGGAIASTRAERDGCVDTWVTLPKPMAAGSHELCAVPVGQASACAVIRIAGNSESGRGFARTGFLVLPWVLGAIAAIMVGRRLTRGSPAARQLPS